MISDRSGDTEDWSNDAENSALVRLLETLTKTLIDPKHLNSYLNVKKKVAHANGL